MYMWVNSLQLSGLDQARLPGLHKIPQNLFKNITLTSQGFNANGCSLKYRRCSQVFQHYSSPYFTWSHSSLKVMISQAEHTEAQPRSAFGLWSFSSRCTEITLSHSLHVSVPAHNALLHLALYLQCLGNVIVLALNVLVLAYTSFYIPVTAEKIKHICLLQLNHVLENQINIQAESP